MPPKLQHTASRIEQAASARGDDSTLATHGADPHYWYSVGDGHRLCLHIRQQRLSTHYVEAEDVIVNPGEDNSSTRENSAGIFIADPYYYTSDNSSFTDYLTSDIDKIIKQGAYSGIETRAWSRLPNKLIIPLLSGAHWRTVCAEIDYGERNEEIEDEHIQGEHIHSWVREPSLKVILNDPYGGYNVSAIMANDIKESLVVATDRLLRKHYNDDSITITDTDDRVIVQKTVVDQQGRGSNGWDCGPITFSNVADYVNAAISSEDNTSLSGTAFKIPTVDNPTHDAHVREKRAAHIAAYQTVAGERIDISMCDRTVALLSEEAEKIKQSYLTKSSAFGLDKQISQLSPEDITHFFAILESMKQSTDYPWMEFTEEQKQEALDLVLEEFKLQSKPVAIFSSQKSATVSIQSQIAIATAPLSLPQSISIDTEIPSALQTFQNKLKTIYRAQDKLPKLVEDPDIPDQYLKDHYVKLQIVLNGENKEKSDIDLARIFEDVEGTQKAATKILITGVAGSGKSSLTDHIKWKWAQEDAGGLWSDKFDFVFKVSLKTISSFLSKSLYDGKEKRDHGAACFIHYNLPDGFEESGILNQIIEVVEGRDKDKILLLLDGFDEISRTIEENQSAKIMYNKIFAYPNVIMTTRPKAFDTLKSSKFGRIIENEGFDTKDLDGYINKYFAVLAQDDHIKRTLKEECKKSLTEFLCHNTTIKSTCTIPINASMMCLTWQDPEIRKTFQEIINSSTLYRSMLYWLGKKYISRNKYIADKISLPIEDLSDKKTISEKMYKVFNKIPTTRFLAKIAYKSFALYTSNKIPSVLFAAIQKEKDIKDLPVSDNEIIKYGLLKEILNEDKKIDHYEFVHPTFQEYLCARYIKQELQNPDIATVKETVMFVAEHRNEPKYLQMLKFLAGEIIEDRIEPSELVSRFWESMTCNIDGMIELDVERKVMLLMYLLAESKNKHGEFNTSISNLSKIEKFIDDTIFYDITRWSDEIINSRYISERIYNTLQDIISLRVNSRDKDIAKINQVNVALKISTHLLASYDIVKTSDISRVISLLNDPEWTVKKSAMNFLIQAMTCKKITDAKEIKMIIIIIVLLSCNVAENIQDAKNALMKITSLGAEEQAKDIIKLLKDLIVDSEQFPLADILGCLSHEQNEVVKAAFQACHDYFDKSKALHTLAALSQVASKAQVIEIIYIIKDLYASKIYTSSPNSTPTYSISDCRYYLVKIAIEAHAKMEVMEALQGVVKPEDLYQWMVYIQSGINTSTEDNKPEYVAFGQEFTQEFLWNRFEFLTALNPEQASEGLELLKTFILQQPEADAMLPTALCFFAPIVKIAPTLAQESIAFLKTLSMCTNFKCVSEVLQCLVEIVKQSPELSKEEIALEAMAVFKTIYSHHKSGYNLESLIEIIKVVPESAREKITLSVITFCQECLVNNDGCSNHVIINILVKIAEEYPNCAPQIVQFLTRIIVNWDYNDCIGSLFENLENIIKIAPAMVDLLISFLGAQDLNLKYKGIVGICNVATALTQSQTGIILGLFQDLATDMNDHARKLVTMYLSKLVKVATKDQILAIIVLLKERFIDDNADIKVLAARSINEAISLLLEREDIKLVHDLIQDILDTKALEIVPDTILKMEKYKIKKQIAETISEGHVIKIISKIEYFITDLNSRVQRKGIDMLKEVASIVTTEQVHMVIDLFKSVLQGSEKHTNTSEVKEALTLIASIVSKAQKADIIDFFRGDIWGQTDDTLFAIGRVLVIAHPSKIMELLKELLVLQSPYINFIEHIPYFKIVEAFIEVFTVVYTTSIDHCDLTLEFLRYDDPQIRESLIKEMHSFVTKGSKCNISKLKLIEILSGIMRYKDVLQLEATSDVSHAIIATDLLEQIPNLLFNTTQNAADELVQTVLDQYAYFMSLGKGGKEFLHKLYQVVLSQQMNSEFNDLSFNYITKCLQEGFTTSFIYKDYQVIVDGIAYKLNLGLDDNVKKALRFEELVNIAMNAGGQEHDLLLQQYTEHKPLFENSGLGIRIAASDIISLSSLVRIDDKLNIECWQISLLSLVDNIDIEYRHKNTFVLVEHRDAFGYEMIFRVSSNGKVDYWHKHPLDINTEFRKEIFGEMLYVSGTQPLYCITKILDMDNTEISFNKIKKFIIDLIANDQRLVREEVGEASAMQVPKDVSLSNFAIMKELLLDSHIVEESLLEELGLSLHTSFEEYVQKVKSHAGATPVSSVFNSHSKVIGKDEILALKDLELERYRSDEAQFIQSTINAQHANTLSYLVKLGWSEEDIVKARQDAEVLKVLIHQVQDLQRGNADVKTDIAEVRQKLRGETGKKAEIREKDVWLVHGIIYDNKILNYPDLLKKVQEYFLLDKILELSTFVSEELINQVIEYNDHDLFLAGLISVNYNMEI